MSDYVLTIPEEVYQRARQIAQETAQPVDEVLIEYLRTLPPLLPVLPPDEEAELEALKYLSDDALWTIAHEELSAETATRLALLMDNNSAGTLTESAHQELVALVERGQKLTLRKSEAAAILTQRGYSMTTNGLSHRE